MKSSNTTASFERIVIGYPKANSYRMMGFTADDLYVMDISGTLNQLKARVDLLLKMARKVNNTDYRITKTLGDNVDIAPMFAEAPYNCILPIAWKSILPDDEERRYW